jgi:hypothetical protein
MTIIHSKKTKMAEVKDNVLTRGFSGTISKLLTLRQRVGRIFVGKLRGPNSVPLADEFLAKQAKFKSSIDLSIKILY